jgi:cellulose synthase/poly-beta-1,6-N-acetylglucosamine synthase-like glycosyltransferase
MKPFFSVIIPSRNSAKTIRYTIDSLKKLDYPKSKFEVIIVDSSDDGTKDILKKLKGNFRIIHYPVPEKNQRNSNILRNIGAKKARYNTLVFLDADCIVDKNWLNDYAAHMDDVNSDIIGGVTVEIPGSKFYSNYFNHSIGKIRLPPKAEKIITLKNFHKYKIPQGGNFFIKKSVLKDVGFFDEQTPSFDEFDLFYRAVKKGYKIITVPNATVKTTSISKFIDITKIFLRFGKGFGYVALKHRNCEYVKSRFFYFVFIDLLSISFLSLLVQNFFFGACLIFLTVLMISFYYKIFLFKKSLIEIPAFVFLDFFFLCAVYQFSTLLFIFKNTLKKH